MKKTILALAFAAFSFVAVHAQSSGVSFAGGVRLGLPVGSFGDTHSFGIGAELQGEARVAPTVSIPFSAGYTRFFGKDLGGYKVDGVGLIPILAGIRVYPSPTFFVGGKLGYGVLTGGGSSTGAFDYEPQIGYNGQRMQVSFGYNGLTKEGSTLAHLALVALVKF